MNTSLWPLLALLADGLPHQVQNLAKTLNKKVSQLNAVWQEMPEHLKSLLHQHNGIWQLAKPLAIIPEQIFTDSARC